MGQQAEMLAAAHTVPKDGAGFLCMSQQDIAIVHPEGHSAHDPSLSHPTFGAC